MKPLQIGDACMVRWRDHEGTYLLAAIVERRPANHWERRKVQKQDEVLYRQVSSGASKKADLVGSNNPQDGKILSEKSNGALLFLTQTEMLALVRSLPLPFHQTSIITLFLIQIIGSRMALPDPT